MPNFRGVNPLRAGAEHKLDFFGQGPWLFEQKVGIPLRGVTGETGVTPASSSSQFSIGVTSTATVGPKLDPPPVMLQLGAAPISTIATGAFWSSGCAKAGLEQRNKATINHLIGTT